MDFKSPIAGRYVRIIAIIALLLGLSDAARLLGVTGAAGQSPIATLGVTGFPISPSSPRALFAAGVQSAKAFRCASGATGIELVMYLMGSRDIEMSAIGFAVRLVLLVSILLVFALSLRFRERAHD